MHSISKRWTPASLLVGLLLTALLTLQPATVTHAAALALLQSASPLATTEITDTIFHADGSAANGSVVISWPQFTTATGQSIPAGSTSATLAPNGVLDLQLAANAGSNPMGSYYTVVYHLDDGSVSREYWVVPASATPVKVSAIRSTVLPLSVAQQTASVSYVNQAIARAVTGGVTPQDSSAYVLKSGDTMTGPLVLPADPTSASQAATKHYVDVATQQATSGSAQKVSLLPQATQVVVQPTGTQLQTNLLNGQVYASQYVTGNGNNAIANATASPDCSAGCNLNVEGSYHSTESYNMAALPDTTHITDMRNGGQHDSTINPALGAGRSIDQVATVNNAISGQTVVSQSPGHVALSLSLEALAGGTNLFPESIEGTVPYFKTNYLAQQTTGSFNTLGQHQLTGQSIDCFGVGDCLVGSQFLRTSGGFRDEADEGAHPADLSYYEDTRVFTGTCATGCSTGSTSVKVTPTGNNGTQGEGRFLIDTNPSKVLTAGQLIGGISGSPYSAATFSGTSFPLSTFFQTAQLIPSQANNIAPGNVTLAIATSGVTAGYATNTAAAPSSSGTACVADRNPTGNSLPFNYEMARYTVVDGTHLQMTLNKVHAAGSTIAIGGLCGYGLEQTVDTQGGIRQLFPVIGAYSPTALYYTGGQTPIVGMMNQTSGYLNISAAIASVARTGNLVTLTATGNFPQDINGLTLTVAGVADSSYNGSFAVTTTGPNTLTYAQTGPNSTSAGGTISILTGGYVLYPMAEVLGVLNPATRLVDGQMTLAPNTVAWAAGDPVEQPHYFEERLSGELSSLGQTVPRPTAIQIQGITYGGNNSGGLVGWEIRNASPTNSYLGAGGTHVPPLYAFSAQGLWQTTAQLTAGQQAVFNIPCNYRGCNRWNSTYDLFELQSSAGYDTMRFQPQTSSMTMNLRGQDYTFTPQAFTANTINVSNLNAGAINGQVSGNSITSGAVAAAYLPLLGGSGAAHAAGIAPDPGATGGTTRFLREDGTWASPTGGGNLLAGATADYNFLQGSGSTVLDGSGNNNSATLVAGASPSWAPTGLAFAPGQGVSLPATLNGTRSYFAALYINPISAGSQPVNMYPVLLSSSTGGTGFNFMYAYTPAPGSFLPNAYAPTLYANNQIVSAAPNLISGFHVLAAVLGSGSGSTDHLYIDGIEVASYIQQGNAAGLQTSGNLFLGSSGVYPWQTSGINGTIFRLRTYATALNATSVQGISTAILNEVASRGVAVAPVNVPQAAPQLQAVGDSITFGQGVSTPWPSLLTLTNQPSYTITDWGITGISLAAINGSEPNRAALRCRTSSGPSLAVVFAGTNDFALTPSTGPSVLMNLLGEVQTMKQAGCRVFVGTMLSRAGNDVNGNPLDADKDAYDALILSQARAGGADGIIDFAANPLLGADGANTGAWFQSDHIHPTQAGQQLLANAASNVLNYTFGANENSPHVVTTLGYSMTAGDGYVSLSGLTGAGTLTLPDCTGQSGATYRVNNPQSAYAVTVAPFNNSQLINGLGSVTVPANATLSLRDTPNPKTTAGCHWEM